MLNRLLPDEMRRNSVLRMTPDGILARFWRRRVMFVSIVAAVLCLTIAALILLPVQYMATGAVIVAEPDPGLAEPSAVWAQKIGDPADLESQLVILRSPSILRLAVEQPGAIDAIREECAASGGLLAGKTRCDDIVRDPTAMIDYLSTRYSINAAGRSRVINISYQSQLPTVAQTLANALINAFLVDQKDSLSSGRETAAKYLWQELANLDSDIRTQDAQIEEYRRTNGLMRGATAPISSERLTSISQQLAAAQQANAQASARLKEIREDRLDSASTVLDNRAIADLKQQISTARRQLAGGAAVFGPRHPQLRIQQDSLDALQSQLTIEIQKIADSTQKEYNASADLVTSLKARMEEATNDAAKAASSEASVENMVRGVEVKRRQYSELYQRAGALETERRSLVGSTRLISLAEIPSKPFFPKKSPFLAAGMAFGLILASAAVLMRERISSSAGTPSEPDITVEPAAPSEKSTSQRIVAGTPAADRPKHASGMLKPTGQGASLIIAELPSLKAGSLLDLHGTGLSPVLRRASSSPEMHAALGTLLENLYREGLTRSLKYVLVTSSIAGEGKTFTTIALARAAALSGLNVLALDCSPKAGFSEALQAGNDAGIANIVNERADPVRLVQRDAVSGLHFISAGTGSLSFSRTENRRHMAALLKWAKPYDLVLLDGPSLDEGADKLSALVDGFIACAQRNTVSRERPAEIEARFNSFGARMCGIVLTVPRTDPASLGAIPLRRPGGIA